MTQTAPSLPPRRPPASAPTPPRSRSLLPAVAVLAFLAAWTYLLIVTLDSPVDDVPAAGLVLFPALLAVIAWTTRRVTRPETRFDLRAVLLAGFSFRVLGMTARYSSPVDALVYHREGVRLANEIRHFDLFPETGQTIPGTGWIRYVSGVVHVAVLDDMISTFIIFTLFSFVGCYLLYRAFVHAVPEGDHKRYALLIFFWPSLCYWPSSIGKEAWMILGVGIVAWGVSRVVTHRALAGLSATALGLAVMSLARPHVALMAVAGLGVALLARPGTKQTAMRTIGRLLSVVLLVLGGSLIAGQTAERLKIDNDGTEGISQALDATSAQTGQGSGAFTPHIVRTPLDYPIAFATVWFRPTPLEARAGGSAQVLSSVENVLLLGLFLLSWRRLRSLPRALLRVPYVTFAVTYALVFVYAFAAIGNFGILARQRTQGLVLFFVVLCAPIVAAAPKHSLAGLRAERAGRSRHGHRSTNVIERARARRHRRHEHEHEHDQPPDGPRPDTAGRPDAPDTAGARTRRASPAGHADAGPS